MVTCFVKYQCEAIVILPECLMLRVVQYQMASRGSSVLPACARSASVIA